MFCGGKATGGAQPVFRWKGNTGCAGIHGTEDGMQSVDTAIARCVRRLSCRLQYTASLRSMHGGVRNSYSFSRKLPTLASHPLSQLARPCKLPVPMQVTCLRKLPTCASHLSAHRLPAHANRSPTPSHLPVQIARRRQVPTRSTHARIGTQVALSLCLERHIHTIPPTHTTRCSESGPIHNGY